MIKKSPTIEKILNEEEKISVPCPICFAEGKQTNDKVVANDGYPNVKFQNVICKTCGLTRINPRMSQKGYERFYKEAFFEYLDPYNRPAYVEEFENTTNDKYWTNGRRKIMPYIYGWLRPDLKTVLDIGAGYGTILYYLQKEKGMQCLGIDPDPESVKIAKEKFGVEIQDFTVEGYFEKHHEKFDVVILEQTFEHLLDPLVTLKEIKKRLTPEGFCYIGVPNAYKFGAPYSLYYQLAHTYNYTPYSLKKLAELAGLRVFDVRNPYGHPLEVLICHPDANYPTEREAVLNVGQDYKEVIREVLKKKWSEKTRFWAKNLLTNLLGKNIKEKVRLAVDKIFGYRY